MNTGKILVGLLAGAAAGAALGVLLAPKESGKALKKEITKKDDYTEAVKEKVVNFLFALIDKLTRTKENAMEAKAAS